MPECEFSEDEYEDALIDELKNQYGPGRIHFKPSRTLENSLGYDFAIETNYDYFRRPGVMLDDPRLLGLVPPQRRAMIPGRFVTALVQCKIPYHVSRRHATTQHIFDYWREPYFRFDLDSEQNQKLADTEQALQSLALVRYGTPCFATFSEIEGWSAARLVTQRTHFQSPARTLGHRLYTYVSPLRPGRAYSTPEDIPPDFLAPNLVRLGESVPNMRWCAYVLLIWQSLLRSKGLTQSLGIETGDLNAADLALGQLADLPLDPLGLLDVETQIGFTNALNQEGQLASLRSYAAMIFAIQRIFRSQLRCKWNVFWTSN
ncbi:hypothetical protein [Rosistilla oblonga]|uniref:hypothetical protein n=1 Tax=Rosistilla oblonga TaxID=2527990 RepID=UPI003A97315D